MAFQFAHIETYSRKGNAKGGGSVSWILGEARRDEGACPHVFRPGEPKQIYGCSLLELEKLHDELCVSVRYEITGGKSRAIRQDQHTLFTVVCSYPVRMNEVRGNPNEERHLQEWQNRNVAWLQAEYGDDLKCIVLHDDEEFPHIHAYVLPDDLRCRNLHVGVAAKEAIMKAGPEDGEDSKAHNKRGDIAYRAAMSAWQDRYFDQVGLPSGLTRFGPGKRRLSRDAWKAEQAAVKSVQTALEQVRGLDAKRAAYVAKVKADGASYIEKTRSSAQAEAEKLKADALAKADVEIRKVRSFANWIRSFWDSLRISSIRKSIWNEVQPIIDHERKRVTEVENRLRIESSRRVAAETRLSNVHQSIHTLTTERNKLRRQRDQLLHSVGEPVEPGGPKFR
ncbi:hypothetical protein L614_001000000450 [Ochrobactrum sp. J50]|uniref:plasmid recombination protein n=1 Tax=Ochrobactrum sp. J50 TaxID=936132 RepID=UPI0011A3CAF7|nr:plasmid recombination protein [Ochrobactrum sp. J50]TWH04021.1 hypothetical protein L614_001000000450 [Ochrobactrum sp. J50]